MRYESWRRQIRSECISHRLTRAQRDLLHTASLDEPADEIFMDINVVNQVLASGNKSQIVLINVCSSTLRVTEIRRGLAKIHDFLASLAWLAATNSISKVDRETFSWCWLFQER